MVISETCSRPLDTVRHFDEGAELREVTHHAFNNRPWFEFLRGALPGIAQRLLQAESDAPLAGLQIEHDDLHGVTDFQQILRMPDLARPGHFRNVDQPFDTRLDLDESTEILEARYRARHADRRRGVSRR